MLSSSGTNRKIFITFTIGTFVGFMFTYFAVQLWRPDATSEGVPKRITRSEFLPRSPHSHGEMDEFVGPEQQQSWHDFEDEHHHGRWTEDWGKRSDSEQLCMSDKRRDDWVRICQVFTSLLSICHHEFWQLEPRPHPVKPRLLSWSFVGTVP